MLFEIQALRAVAVLLVVVYHVWPSRLPSGFVGVDVFFVISGFLITSHLLREIRQSGRLDITAFWARRIRRLLPASVLVLIACAVLLWSVYPDVYRWPGMEQVAFAGFYALNWLLATNAVDYLHAGDSATLVQHFWSLSVEEQFYIAWPLILLVTLAVFAGRRSRRGDRPTADSLESVFLVVVVVLVIVSFAYSVILSHYRPSFAYFDTGVRAWELGLGAVFAVVLSRYSVAVEQFRSRPGLARTGLGLCLGIVMIIGSAFVIGPDAEFPGWVAIFPTVGALLIIVVGLPAGSWLHRPVSWRPVQYIGDISYELYLVHWPVLVTFLVLVGERPRWWQGILLLAVSMALAAALHKAVRMLPNLWASLWKSRRVAFGFAAVGALTLVLCAGLTFGWQQERASAAASVKDKLVSAAGGSAPMPGDSMACVGAAAMLSGADCPNRFVMGNGVDLAAAATDLDRQNWCLTWYNQDWLQCDRGDLGASRGTIALLGDSHAGAMTGAMDTYFRDRGWRVVTYTRFGCSGLERPVPELSTATDQGRNWDACVTWAERARADIASRSDITAVVMTYWERSKSAPGDGQPARLTPDSIAESLAELGASGKPLIYVEDPPNTIGKPVPECLASVKSDIAPCSTARSTSYDPQLMKDGISRSGLDIGYVSTVDAYCDNSLCYAVIGDVVVYTDDNHVSDTWARSLIPYIGPRILDDIAARQSAR